MEPYTCDKCKKEIPKGKSLFSVLVGKKFIQICHDCRRAHEKGLK